MAQPPLTLRRWKRAEYERVVDLGLFDGDPVELIGGQLVVAEPQSRVRRQCLRNFYSRDASIRRAKRLIDLADC